MGRRWGPELGCWARSGRDRDVHILCCVLYREAFTIPLIPLGLKETKDVDFSVVLKVNLKAMGSGLIVYKEKLEVVYLLQVALGPVGQVLADFCRVFPDPFSKPESPVPFSCVLWLSLVPSKAPGLGR